ncbi:MAG: MBL fold metallo-hydrolase [Bdellovibrionales bacterium]|nr:MBL fold metallo-hydrolase [Bdellovibrionales bacterium]
MSTAKTRFHFSEILGNSQKLDGGAMFGNAPRAVWQKWISSDDIGRIPLACRALLIEFDDKKILFETGIGAFFDPKLADRFGVETPKIHQLRENLKKIALEPEDITHVILTHLHFDHAGGLLPTYEEIQNGNHGIIFKNAEILVGKEAWERALHPHSRDRASFIADLPEKLKATGKLRILDGHEQLFDGRLRFFISNGHTPGQMLSIFRGENTSIVFCGDLVPGRHWVHLPITMGYDRFPELLIEEKETLYKMSQDWLFFFTHDDQVAASYIELTDKKKFEPVSHVAHPRRDVF